MKNVLIPALELQIPLPLTIDSYEAPEAIPDCFRQKVKRPKDVLTSPNSVKSLGNSKRVAFRLGD